MDYQLLYELIEENELDELFDNHINDFGVFKKKVRSLKQQYNQAESDNRFQLITNEAFNVILNRVSKSLLELIEQLENPDIDTDYNVDCEIKEYEWRDMDLVIKNKQSSYKSFHTFSMILIILAGIIFTAYMVQLFFYYRSNSDFSIDFIILSIIVCLIILCLVGTFFLRDKKVKIQMRIERLHNYFTFLKTEQGKRPKDCDEILEAQTKFEQLSKHQLT